MTVPDKLSMATVLVAVAVAVTVATPASAAGTDARSALTVELDADGDAEVALGLTYDLATAEERDAFESLRGDAAARDDVTATFRDRMRSVARSAANATGREMRVSGGSVDLRVADGGDVGIATLTVNWTGFAAVDGDRLRVDEPFASGFDADYPLRLVAPTGYDFAGATVAPDDRADGVVEWSADTTFDGFSATFGPTDSGGEGDSDRTSSSTADGFGAAVAVAVLAAVAALVGRND